MIWRKPKDKWQSVALHDSMVGLPAFIVCNGPSMDNVDTSTLRGSGRVVIALNNAAPKVRPDWWMGMDSPECYDKSIFSEAYSKLVHPAYWREFQGTRNLFTADIAKNVPFYDGGEEDVFRWDRDTFRVSIQLAIYLGCRQLCFVGVNLSTNHGDYVDGSYLTNKQRASNGRLYDANFEFLKWHMLNRPAVSFVSASPDSRINTIMPFMEMATIIEKIEAGIPKGRELLHNSMRDGQIPHGTKATT